MTTITTIPLSLIDEPTDAHRITIDETAMQELADSIRDIGLLQPIIVRPTTDDRYEIIAGHRRYIAHRMLGRHEIECCIRHDDETAAESARFAENLQRSALSPMEEATSLARYIERTGKSTADVARAISRSTWWVEHRLALLDMPDRLCELTHTGELPAGAALELAKVTDTAHREYLTDFAVRSGAAVPVIREWVHAWKLSHAKDPHAEPPKPDMPVEGETVTITIPCYLCGTPHDYRTLKITRVCRDCATQVAQATHQH